MADTDLGVFLNAVDNISRPLQQATAQMDALTASMQRASSAGSKLILPDRFVQQANQIGRSIDAMAAGAQRSAAQFNAQAQAIGGFTNSLASGLAAAQGTIQAAAVQTQAFQARMDGALQSAHNFGQSMQSAGQSLALGFTVPLVASAAVLTSFDQSAAKLQAGEAFLRTAKQFGLAGDEIIATLQEASGETITSLEAAQAASRALVYGVGGSVEQMGELMLIARDRARVFGVTATQAFNDLTLGIGRQSRLILDNLGIIVRVEESQEAYADSIGKTVEQLTLDEQRQAFLNAVLDQTRATLDKNALATRNASEEYQHQRAQINELMDSFQMFVLPILNKILAAFNALPKAVSILAVGFVALTLVAGPLLSALGAVVKLSANTAVAFVRLATGHGIAAAAANTHAVAEANLARSLVAGSVAARAATAT